MVQKYATIDVMITGMRCTRCSNKIEENLRIKDGVKKAVVSVGLSKGSIEFDDHILGTRDVVDAIKELGFGVTLIDKSAPVDLILKHQHKELKLWRDTFLSCLIFGFATMVLHAQMLIDERGHGDHESGPALIAPGLSSMNLLMFFLATPTQLVGARVFYPPAFTAIKRGRSNMDVLILMATATGYTYSILVLIYFMLMRADYSPRTFFDIPPMLFTFVSLGRWLEHIARGKTSEALMKLTVLQPKQAVLVRGYRLIEDHTSQVKYTFEKEETTDIRLVQRGDYIKVEPNSKIPVDGTIIHGNAHVDESLVTGESLPVSKPIGARVLCGSINLSDTLLIQATEVGSNTTLAKIVKLVESAQTTKAPIQQYADKVAAYFVPVIFFLSTLAFFGWFAIGLFRPKLVAKYYREPSDKSSNLEIAVEFAFQTALTVLSIACPCALGLATPTAVMVGTGVGARNGILVKSAEALENAHRVSHIVMDKTGTITSGTPVIENLLIFGSHKYNSIIIGLQDYVKKIIYIMGSTEIYSHHPIARTLSNFSYEVLNASSWLESKRYHAEPGLGVEAEFYIGAKCCDPFESSLIDDATAAIIRKHPNYSAWKRKNENLISIDSLQRSEVAVELGLDVEGNSESKLETLVKGVKLELLFDGHTSSIESLEDDEKHNTVSVLIGNLTLMTRNNVHLHPSAIKILTEYQNKGNTCVLMALDRHLVAIVSLSDEIKPEAQFTVSSLKRMNLTLVLLTGDNERSAESVANKVGIDNVFAEVLPCDKMAKIRSLQDAGFIVAMVGDGVNDSPALAQGKSNQIYIDSYQPSCLLTIYLTSSHESADVGIAIAKGSDIAVEAANIVLVRNDLLDVVYAIDISRRTVNRIRLNFVFATFYNILGIPLAAGLFLPLGLAIQPWMGSAAMAASSLSVVCSSLALKFYRRPKREKLQSTDRFGYWDRRRKTLWQEEGDEVELSHGLLRDPADI